MKCIVIGAGIAGASTAYYLSKMGADTVLVDRKDQGQATDAAAGIICPWLTQRRNQAWYRLVKAGARAYPGLIEELKRLGETDTGYAQVGALHLRHDPDKLAQLEERARTRKADAPEIGDIALCDEPTTRALFPLLADGFRAVRIGGAARVDGRALRDALIRSAVRQGAAHIRGDAAIAFEDRRVAGVSVGADLLPADRVIVCAGIWAGELLQPLGIPFRVTRQKAQIAHLKVGEAYDTGRWPVVMPPSDHYLLAFEQGRIVAGATHEDDAAASDTRVTAGGLHEVLSKALAAAPGLGGSELIEARVGFRPFTPGFLPVFGAIPGWEGLLAANGLGASGLTAGPYLGEQLAKLALGLEPDIDPSDYDIRTAIE